MDTLKNKAIAYFDNNANRYREDHYLRNQYHAKWIRHQKILELIKEFVPTKESILLDIGCGPGFLAQDLAKMQYRGFGMDTSNQMIELASNLFIESDQENWSFLLGDAEDTQFQDGEFDCIIASGVIEYMDSDFKMLEEMNRLLKPNGYLIINVTNKLGYSTSLNSITNLFKKIPYVMNILSVIRKYILGAEYGADNLGFTPRKHFIFEFKKSLGKSGFNIRQNIHHDFSVLPAPFSTLTQRFLGKIDHKLDFLGKTPLKIFCSSNLICAQKNGS
jgi:ubiquinone/menaquinone biosynthesis C-methylase UbiE